VTPDTLGKFGTPKCELICQLLRCEEPENASASADANERGRVAWRFA
jgi:hypothetical protein